MEHVVVDISFTVWLLHRPTWTKKLYGPNSHKEILRATCSLDRGSSGEQGVQTLLQTEPCTGPQGFLQLGDPSSISTRLPS